ncbi:MAG: hypothetical protein K5876_03245 [Ruminiclostridium sp.]|nr:hypothetical protein [Ruminiclostridium sp.]
MVSSKALNDLGAAYGTSAVSVAQKKKAHGQSSGFGEVMRGTAEEKPSPSSAANESAVAFSAGAEIQRLGMMAQMKKTDFSADLFFDDMDESDEDGLDSAISFDELDELDRITDELM